MSVVEKLHLLIQPEHLFDLFPAHGVEVIRYRKGAFEATQSTESRFRLLDRNSLVDGLSRFGNDEGFTFGDESGEVGLGFVDVYGFHVGSSGLSLPDLVHSGCFCCHPFSRQTS